jgi:hypothetical protein
MNNTSHIYLPGRRKILITAPHAELHKRDGHQKLAEPKTGLIARYLSAKFNCHALVTNGLQEHDPNWDVTCPLTLGDCPFKDAISAIIEASDIQLVIDLHQLHPMRPFDFVIGTNDGKTVAGNELLVEEMREFLLQLAPRVLVNPSIGYSARHQATITRYVAEAHDIPAMQLEINSLLTDEWENVARTLARFVISVAPMNRRGKINKK